MSTLVHSLTQKYANDCAALPDYPSSVNSGIAGDSSHYNSNSYHIAVHHLPVKGGYTNSWSRDKVGSPQEQYAVAVDQSMSTPDMKKEWARFEAVFYDPSDPRRPYVAEYIGWNGTGSAERLDFADGSREVSSDDHKWHSHEAGWRADVGNEQSYRARLSIRAGQTKQQYLEGVNVMPTQSDWRTEALVYDRDKVVATTDFPNGEVNEMKKRQTTQHNEHMAKLDQHHTEQVNLLNQIITGLNQIADALGSGGSGGGGVSGPVDLSANALAEIRTIVDSESISKSEIADS